jgi:hypothetical protein
VDHPLDRQAVPALTDYPYAVGERCWIAAGQHHSTRAAAAATGRQVSRANERCVSAACVACGHLVDLVAAHCPSWSAAAALARSSGWHVEEHRRRFWCPDCTTGREPRPADFDPDQIALTDLIP